jgi:hypothetical protein
MSVRIEAVGTYIRPLLFDHLQKVSVVHNPVKNRTQREPIVSTERGGETNDRYTVFDRSDRRVHGFVFNTFDGMWTLDARVEVRKDTAIGGRGGVVCLIYDNGL